MLEINKKYTVVDDECEAKVIGWEVTYSGITCDLTGRFPPICIDSSTILMFLGESLCTTGGLNREMCVFDLEMTKGPCPPNTIIAVLKRQEDQFVLMGEVKKPEEDHAGQIYNPYTNSWNWF
jgi:hypothetical protein